MPSHTDTSKTESIVAWYTLAAAGTGAIPVPAASAALVAQNGAMISHVASAMGIPISMGTVIESIGMMGAANMVGRQLLSRAPNSCPGAPAAYGPLWESLRSERAPPDFKPTSSAGWRLKSPKTTGSP